MYPTCFLWTLEHLAERQQDNAHTARGGLSAEERAGLGLQTVLLSGRGSSGAYSCITQFCTPLLAVAREVTLTGRIYRNTVRQG